MANALGMDLTGKAVVVKEEIVKPEYDTEFSRAFFCKSGFGCLPETRGTLIYGYWLDNPEKLDNICGYDIEKLYEAKESIGSKEILARLAKNLDKVKRVLAITDIKDPALAKEVKEFFILKAEVMKLKDDLEAKDMVLKNKLNKSIAPKLQEAGDSLYRIEGTIYKFAQISKTTVSYSDLYDMVLSKVNQQIKDMMAMMKEELSKVSSYFKFEEVGEESDPKTIKKIMKEQEKGSKEAGAKRIPFKVGQEVLYNGAPATIVEIGGPYEIVVQTYGADGPEGLESTDVNELIAMQPKKAALERDLLFPIVVVTHPTPYSVIEDILFRVDTLTGLYNLFRGGLKEEEIAGIFPGSEYKQADILARKLLALRDDKLYALKEPEEELHGSKKTAGFWDKVKEAWNKLYGYLSSFVANLTDSADEMEALVEEIQEKAQTQEVEAGLKGIFNARS